MKDKAYDYMNWPGIEAVIYSEEDHPKRIMAPQVVKGGILYQAFLPLSDTAYLRLTDSGQTFPMTEEDEAGYFAVIVPGKKILPHTFVTDRGEYNDPYGFPDVISVEEESRFRAGIAYDIWHHMGAHVMAHKGEVGVLFAVWAPNARRVSVVGDFNEWDGRINPMERHDESGIFELFIPNLGYGERYQFELKLSDGLTYTRPDPYAAGFAADDPRISVVSQLSFRWHDSAYLRNRPKAERVSTLPVQILEVRLADTNQPWMGEKAGEKLSYRSLAEGVIPYALANNFSHIELSPVMEYPDDATGGFQTSGYFAPTARYGAPTDLKYLIDAAHQEGLGVLLDWSPAQFSADDRFLASFDGTCLYEHMNPKQGIHPLWGTKLFNHGRAQVQNFLISNALFWLLEYHADGLRMDGCETMLRLNWARGDSFVPNLFGGVENLDGADFLKHLNSILRRNVPEAILIAEEDTDTPGVTGDVSETNLGFHLKWDLHFMRDMQSFLSLPDEERRKNYDTLTNSMLHSYMENWVLSYSRTLGAYSYEDFLAGVDGEDREEKEALLRCAYVFLMTHPGRKLFNTGELGMKEFFASLLDMGRSEKALYTMDPYIDGFAYLNHIDEDRSVLSFVRKTERDEDMLLVVLNFSDTGYEHLRLGVPFGGKWKEILNTDAATFGGSGHVNSRARDTKEEYCDGQKASLTIRVAPRSAAVFRRQIV